MGLPGRQTLFLIAIVPCLAQTGTLALEATENGAPVAFRVHLKGPDGNSVRAPGRPFWHDHFVCDGRVSLELPTGKYAYEVERGPEYEAISGSVIVRANASKSLTLRLRRLVDMRARGWWSGELHVHRPLDDVPVLMKAEDLYVAPVLTWWNARNIWRERARPEEALVSFDGHRFYHVMGGEDERQGGAFLILNRESPLDIAEAEREWPSPMAFLDRVASEADTWVDIEKPFWWDVPVALALGHGDSIGLANNHMCRSTMYPSEAWGKPRDADRLPPPRGNGFWTQEIYYHILNSGIRIPPSAGSASGVLPNPVGYNRVYVHADGDLTYEKWWEGLRAGRCFVTNGPLLLVTANGKLPGHTFVSSDGSPIAIRLDAWLRSRDRVPAIEIIQNGEVSRTVAFEQKNRPRSIGAIRFEESGWFLVRAIASNDHTFRFASTAPFYVEIGANERRISRASAQFFLDWVQERIQQITIDDAVKRDDVLQYHHQAKSFWHDRVVNANAP
ncbi:MAG: hypothetical protein AMXMBFR4_02830 [Candidatus Hydrogenedentota bacterium]